ncbi:3-dehydroquinate dehydratase, type I [Thermocrinis albus DSM 14484]|uniref:3-dehydroquinate dehydratase n=1 Tax=Thermocrinis albus (strain DSM 14484 / JCM 11386 / HI 11/12) TaxID=638303 RepID=D3SPU0_THEAH|nr:type I 3-dehydroquinate dehydratase [Thermocrinis albus]ADC89177.1 3-dehydroquinate dehydratase, type I [Thermocrinis albus DSM 14484]
MLIAVPVTSLEPLKECKEKGADLIELRVDLMESPTVDRALTVLEEAHRLGLGTILTVRSAREGGRDLPNRLELFEKLSPFSDYTDIELTSLDILPQVRNTVLSAGKKLIISYHNFERTPAGWILKETIREARRWGAHIVKIAVKAESYTDVARLLCAGSQEEGEKILIAMGSYGKISRLAAFVFGSVITYAFLGKATAEGQLPLEEMVRLREIFYGRRS